MTVTDLAKWLLIYQWVYMTKKKTKAVQSLTKKLKKKLTHIYTYKRDLYNEATELQKKVYSDAWEAVYGSKTATEYISMGLVSFALYDSLNDQSLIGKKVMDKALDSFYFARMDNVDELALETNTNKLSDKLIELFDGKKSNPFKTKIATMKLDKVYT